MIKTIIQSAGESIGILPTSTQIPTITETTQPPTITPVPSQTPEIPIVDITQLNAVLKTSLGKGNRDGVERVNAIIDGTNITITFAIEDNFTIDFIKLGAETDTITILGIIYKSLIPYEHLNINGTIAMKDIYGNVAEDVVAKHTYTKETLSKINWAEIDPDNIYKLAETGWIHPELK
jgi:hypothetical protein